MRGIKVYQQGWQTLSLAPPWRTWVKRGLAWTTGSANFKGLLNSWCELSHHNAQGFNICAAPCLALSRDVPFEAAVKGLGV
jgi:hypothetical protein